MGNVSKFPEKKSNIQELFDGVIEDGMNEAVLIGFVEEGPMLGISGLENPFEILGLLDVAKDTVMTMLQNGYFEGDKE